MSTIDFWYWFSVATPIIGIVVAIVLYAMTVWYRRQARKYRKQAEWYRRDAARIRALHNRDWQWPKNPQEEEQPNGHGH